MGTHDQIDGAAWWAPGWRLCLLLAVLLFTACGPKRPHAPDVGVSVGFRQAGAAPTAGQQAALADAGRLQAQAASLVKTGRYAEAEALYRQALTVQEHILGLWHADVAATLNQLIRIYRAQGRDDEVARLDQRVMAIVERLLGPQRPNEATQLSEEAARYQAQGQYAQAEPLYRRALAVLEQSLGPTHLDVAVPLNNLASLYFAQQKYAQAEPLYRRALAIREPALGPAHLDVALSLNNLAALCFAQGQYSEAELLYKRAIAIQENALGPAHQDVAMSLNHVAALYQAQSQYSAAEALYKRALTIREKALGPTHAEVAVSLNDLAGLYRLQGRYSEAEPLYKRALAVREKALGPTHSEVAMSLNDLAGLYHIQGKYSAAEPLYRRALAIEEKTLGPMHRKVATSLNNVATLAHAQGRYSEAEPLYKRAVEIWQQVLGPDHPDVAAGLNNLAELYYAQRRYQEAEQLYRRALALLMRTHDASHPSVATSLGYLAKLSRMQGQETPALPLYQQALTALEQKLGSNHPDVASSLDDLAGLYRAQGQYAAAEPLYRRALAIREQAFGAKHPAVAMSLNDLAGLAQAQGQYEAAEALYQRALAMREQILGLLHPAVATNLNDLATLYHMRGQFSAAEPLYRLALSTAEQTLGPDHPDVAVSLTSLAALLVAQEQPALARPLYERARRIHLGLARLNSDLDDATLRALLRQGHAGLQAYAVLLADLARATAGDAKRQAITDAFVVVEQMRGGTVQAALARAGAHAATDAPQTASLAGQVQVLREQRQLIRQELTTVYSTAAAERSAERLTQLQQAERALDRDLAAATDRLRVALPQYAELTAPIPIELEAVTQLIRPNEALLSLYALPDRLLVWLLRPGQPFVYHEVVMPRTELAAQVSRVRASLDQSQNPELGAGRLLPFDVVGAYTLYTLLLEPLRPALAGVQHLLVVPDEVLLPLPFGVLVTEAQGEAYQSMAQWSTQPRPLPAHELAGYSRLAWLMHEYALTVLPSATSLRALRQFVRPPVTGREPLIGFGDPVLQGNGQRRGGTMLAGRGTSVPLDALRDLPPLPGTRQELHMLAQELGADPSTALYLGEAANEPVLRHLNTTGRLATAQVLAFATHALVGGELVGLSQPALVLTPPAEPDAHNDGLLSLEEILELKLPRTDWIILSACNTGASDGSGEGLSGLARAFFFAGARSVLVSHWSVDDRATQELMTAIFRRYARDPTVSRAEALRQGMLALLQSAQGSTTYFAHPFAWAPFFLVGEGTERTP